MKKMLYLIPLLITNITAHATSSPDKCPSVSVIASQGVDYAMPCTIDHHDNTVSCAVGYYNDNYYDTKQKWRFAMFWIKAETDSKAIEKGNELVKDLYLEKGPHYINNRWTCFYKDKKGILTTASTWVVA